MHLTPLKNGGTMEKRPGRAFKIALLSQITMFNYFRDVRAEMRHVSWPSRQLIIAYTLVVVAVSLAVAIYLGVLDYVFRLFIEQIIK